MSRCSHKFVDSNVCLLCGWEPPPRRRFEQPEDVQFIGPRGTVFTLEDDRKTITVFASGATIGVLGGRRGCHQLVPLEDLIAVAEHAKARWR